MFLGRCRCPRCRHLLERRRWCTDPGVGPRSASAQKSGKASVRSWRQ